MKASVETITPTIAAEWLQNRNVGNRPISRATVARYARDMQHGFWQQNGEALILDHQGLLKNGQHRLAACVEAKVPFVTLVVREVDEGAFKTMDTGKMRNASDVLVLQNEVNTKVLAGTLSLLTNYHLGRAVTKPSPSRMELLQTLRDHPTIRKDVALVAEANPRLGRHRIAFLSYVGRLAHGDVSAAFINQVITGLELPANSPAYVLRERLLAQNNVHTLPVRTAYAITVKAFNLAMQKRTASYIRFLSTEDVPLVYGVTPDCDKNEVVVGGEGETQEGTEATI